MTVKLVKWGIVGSILLWLVATILLPAKISLVLGLVLFIGLSVSLFWAVGKL